eukprot:358192-Chlamydomonas_euryale.AAC.16
MSTSLADSTTHCSHHATCDWMGHGMNAAAESMQCSDGSAAGAAGALVTTAVGSGGPVNQVRRGTARDPSMLGWAIPWRWAGSAQCSLAPPGGSLHFVLFCGRGRTLNNEYASFIKLHASATLSQGRGRGTSREEGEWVARTQTLRIRARACATPDEAGGKRGERSEAAAAATSRPKPGLFPAAPCRLGHRPAPGGRDERGSRRSYRNQGALGGRPWVAWVELPRAPLSITAGGVWLTAATAKGTHHPGDPSPSLALPRGGNGLPPPRAHRWSCQPPRPDAISAAPRRPAGCVRVVPAQGARGGRPPKCAAALWQAGGHAADSDRQPRSQRRAARRYVRAGGLLRC